MSEADSLSSTERRLVEGQYITVTYDGGFRRTGNILEVNPSDETALVEFHYSIHGKYWFPWERLS